MTTQMTKVFFLSLAVTVFGTHLQAGVLTNKSLKVILGANGAIDSVEFGGANFFKPGLDTPSGAVGTSVSDFGIQNGTDAKSFLLNDTNGGAGLTLAESDFTYHGAHTWNSGADLDYLRTYSLVAGLNAIRVTSTIKNVGSASFTVSQFDTFDPDQAYGLIPGSGIEPFETFNDAFSLAGGRVGQASIDVTGSNGIRRGLTMIVGSLDSRAVLASGDPLQIGSGDDLNEFFRAPADAANKLDDEGTHIGFRQLLNPNESTTFTYIMAFGANPTDAQRAFTLASVPEPASVAVFGALGLCGLFLLRRSSRA